MISPGYLITFEGGEGCGKTTQIKLVSEKLQQEDINVVTFREPGGTRIGELVRDILHNPLYEEMGLETEALLYQAARAQLVEERLQSALENGELVILDRFGDSTRVYQGVARNLGKDRVEMLLEFATRGISPNLTIYYDIVPEVGLNRRVNASLEINRMDALELDFHRQVRQAYLELCSEEPERIVKIDGSKSIEEVYNETWKVVEGRLLKAGFINKHIDS